MRLFLIVSVFGLAAAGSADSVPASCTTSAAPGTHVAARPAQMSVFAGIAIGFIVAGPSLN